MARIELPLLPLHAVLFPQTVLRLRIVEERHTAMIGRCLEADRTFGVVLVRSEDKSGALDLCRVGTSAYIVDAMEEQDGRTLLLVIGQRRFRLLDHRRGGEYPLGRVSWLPEARGVARESVPEVTDLLHRYLRRILSEVSSAHPSADDVDVPEDPEELSYAVAAFLPLTLPQKQRLLEIPGPAERLQAEIGILRQQVNAGPPTPEDPESAVRSLGKADTDWLARWTN